MRPVLSVLVLALAVGGCSDPVAPENIVGKWDQDFSIPGNIFEMDLTLTGSAISGGGHWCGEAGPCGLVGVTGTVSGDLIQLDLTYNPQVPITGPVATQQFRGRLTSPNSLKGSLSAGTPGLAGNVSYHRANASQ